MWAVAVLIVFGGLVLGWECFCRIDAHRRDVAEARVRRIAAAAERDDRVAR